MLPEFLPDLIGSFKILSLSSFVSFVYLFFDFFIRQGRYR